MKLSRLDISNFRKLKQCKIEIADRETIFVGANNSGKTVVISNGLFKTVFRQI